MLMHTKGILVMTPDSAMVLTGKQSLDYSGGVSAEDNFGIGGYDRIMGPNGQAQYWAPDLSGAVDVLLAHYAHTYRAPGERFPRPAPTTDPVDRDVRDSPHAGRASSPRVGEIFDRATNPERKKPFDIRSVLRAVADADHPPLERWVDMLDAENVVVSTRTWAGSRWRCWASSRGRCRGAARRRWTGRRRSPRARCSRGRRRRPRGRSTRRAGTGRWWCWRTCRASTARPSRCAQLQLEYGAEIGRAVVNFDGPDRVLRGLAATTAGRSWCSPGR